MDGTQCGRARAKIADCAAGAAASRPLLFHRPDFPLRAIPILPWRRTVNHDRAGPGNPAETLQCVAQNCFFDPQLLRVAGMLVIASAANPKMRTVRLDALGRRA